MMINIISNLQKVKNLISQYLYRNVQFSRASLNGVLFLSQYFEEGGNRSARRKPSKSG